MLITGRRILLVLSAVVVAAGIQLWWIDQHWLAWILIGAGAISVILLVFVRQPSRSGGNHESENMQELTPHRQKELIRGTSMHLRQMDYRYSVRYDAAGRDCFTAEINTVRLGFIPVVIIDNHTDRQGFGYVAMVYDGHRWRGPGLPCSGSAHDALRHAARCVQPLATEEETRVDI